MDRATLEHFLRILPGDASEISIPRHDSNEILFNSDLINKDNAQKIGAIPAQKGTYRGPKRRWRITLQSMIPSEGTPITIDSLPDAN